SGNNPASVASLGSAYAAAGRKKEALQELARLRAFAKDRHVPAIYYAMIHLALGDLPMAFHWAWEAVGERCDYLVYLRVEPIAVGLAGNPEFLRVMARLHR